MRQPAPLPLTLQSGVFSRQQALSFGVSEQRLRAQDIERIGYGLYCWRNAPTPPEDISLLTSLQDQYPDMWFSHTTAARLWGLELPARTASDQRIHISRQESSTSRRRVPGLVAHSAVILADEVVRHRNLRISRPARVLFDLMRGLSEADLVALGDHLVRIPRPRWESRDEPWETPASLRALLAAHRKTKGIVKARRALEQVRTGSDSRAETHLRLALINAGLPEPQLQVRAFPDSPYTGDLGYPAHQVVIQYDGSTHFTAAQQARDQRRNYDFELGGWRVLIANSEDWKHGFRRIVDRTRRSLSPHMPLSPG